MKVCSKNLKGRYHVEQHSLYGRTVLKSTLKERSLRMWIEFVGSRTESNVRLLS
jgi:hypothetical protein